MVDYNIWFILLHFSILISIVIIVLVKRMKNKSQLHIVFLIDMILVFIWNLGQLLEVYTREYYGHTIMLYVYIYFIGAVFLPISLFFTGYIYANTKIDYKKRYLFFFIQPMIAYVLLLTGKYHNLFIIKYSHLNSETVLGSLFYIFHNIPSYIFIFIGMYFLLRFSIKNVGFFTKQSLLILLGILIPFTVNILSTYNIIQVPYYITPVSFSFGISCFLFAIFKYEFLNIAPIALRTVVDRISDGFIVINEEFLIVEYNQAIVNLFEKHIDIKYNRNIKEILYNYKIFKEKADVFYMYINTALTSRKAFCFEEKIKVGDNTKHFGIEITPLIVDNHCLGGIILLKDITEIKEKMQEIQRNQIILMEQERLASLGHLIGGIAHNLRTPIMSISGAVEGLKDLVSEYNESICDKNVTEKDHHEIASDMQNWLNKITPYCSYMSEIISAVKGQAVSMNVSSKRVFTVSELIGRMQVLMKHELKRYHCNLNIDFQIDKYTEIMGEVSSLIQVFDNIIINSIHAYEGKSGDINLKVIREKNNLIFIIQDYAKGMPEKIKNRIFKEMVTTKGKNGTGLGLYMSYSTVKGHFSGEISVDSAIGKGTTFTIQIPIHNPKN